MVLDDGVESILCAQGFSNSEWGYAHQENVEYEQLAMFVATMQLLVNYSCASKML